MAICVLAYSGGLDTSVMLKWIPENLGYEVVAVTVNVGQGENLDEIVKKARKLGAKDAFLIDSRREFAEEYVARDIKANGLYDGVYPLSTALARPLIAKKVVEIAEKVGAEAIAHGCTGKGNDQVRFEIAFRSYAPHLKILAPVRDWNMSRDGEEKYAKERNIPIPSKSKYSIDQNLWGRSIECGEMEDPWYEPPEEAFEWTVDPRDAPNTPKILEIEFLNGLPSSIDGEELPLPLLIEKLNHIAGSHGVGRIDHIENRVIGLKSREVYEAPAATVLLTAHRDLEKLVLTKRELEIKQYLEKMWSNLVYSGLWTDPSREDIEAFIERTQERVTGTVRVKLFKGSMRVVGRRSPFALYERELITYRSESIFDQKAAEGFIKLWGLSTTTAAKKLRRKV